MQFRLRKLWLITHRWLGLTVGLLFVLLGLTGSLLVFDHAIDEWLNPDLLLTDGTATQRPMLEIVAAAEQAYAGEGSRQAAAASAPRVAGGVWTVWFQGGTEEAPVFARVYVDPTTAAVTGQRIRGEDWMSWIYKLHYTLHGGEMGGAVVGIAGLVLMFSIGTGIFLWWPLWKNGWRAAFTVRRGARLNYDLHKTFGIASSLVLLVLAFTGAYMEFPEYAKSLVTVFSAVTPLPEGLTSTPSSAPRLTPEQAIAIAKEHFPNAAFDHFHPPQDAGGVYEIGLRQPGEIQQSFGRTQLWIDPYEGTVLAVRNPDDGTAADTFIAWQFPLHNGEALGMVGRWIVFFVGLAPAILYVTGLLVWWRKRQSRRRQRDQSRRHHRVVVSPPAPHRAPVPRKPEPVSAAEIG